ncbi:uncharacterized protein [Chironomus tepperi]
MKTQECVAVDRWSPYCSSLVTPIMITSCATGRRISILEYETRTSETTIWVPSTTTSMTTTTMSPTTTTPMIPTVTSTTEAGGPGATHPGNSTTTVATPTAPGACACFPWWPCWCNPCWNMPCHNCHGCMR